MSARSLPHVVCLCAAPSVLLATLMPWESYGFGASQTMWQTLQRLDVFVLMVGLAVVGLAAGALVRPRQLLDQAMALAAFALFWLIFGLFVERGLGGGYNPAIGVYAALLGALACLAASLLVLFPTLAESARELARTIAARRAAAGPAPGWYDDPAGGDGVRWWNGAAWSDSAADPADASFAQAADVSGSHRVASDVAISQ